MTEIGTHLRFEGLRPVDRNILPRVEKWNVTSLRKIDPELPLHQEIMHTFDKLSAAAGEYNEKNQPEELTPDEFDRWIHAGNTPENIWRQTDFIVTKGKQAVGFVNSYEMTRGVKKQLVERQLVSKSSYGDEINWFVMKGQEHASVPAVREHMSERFKTGKTDFFTAIMDIPLDDQELKEMKLLGFQMDKGFEIHYPGEDKGVMSMCYVLDRSSFARATLETYAQTESSRHENHQVELIHIPGSPVGVRFLEPGNPVDTIAGWNQDDTERVAKGIENFEPDNPDSYEDAKKLSEGMRFNNDKNSLRYTVVDISGKPVQPTEEYAKRLTMQDAQKRDIHVVVDEEGKQPWEGVPIGNVVFFQEEDRRVKLLGFDPSEARDPSRPIGPDNPPKKLFLEISYYNIDNLQEQFPHLEAITNPDGTVALTPFRTGIYTAITDVVRRAQGAGYDPKDVVITGYADEDNNRSQRVMTGFGFAKNDEIIQEYSAEYPHPRVGFYLAGDNWKTFQDIYTKTIAPNAEHAQVPPHLKTESMKDSPFDIPLERAQPNLQ